MQDNEFLNNENEVLEEQETEIKPEEQEIPKATVQNIPYSFVPFGFTPESYQEKKEIKKTANTVGAMLLSFFGLLLLIQVFMLAISYIFNGIEGFYAVYSDPAVNQVIQIGLSSVLFTAPFIFIAKVSNYRISDLLELKKPEKGTFLPLFLLGAAFCSFANIAVSYAGQIFQNFGINYDVDYGENPKGIFGFLLTVISTAIVPALVEEFAFRGVIMGMLRHLGDGFAVMTSAVLFGIIHGNFEQMPFAFLVGLALGFIAVKSGSLWTAVAVHSFNNLVSVLMNYLFSDASMLVQNTVYSFFLIITLLLGITALSKLKNQKQIYKFEKADTICSEKQKYKWFFISPTIIIFIVIFVLESLAYFII